MIYPVVISGPGCPPSRDGCELVEGDISSRCFHIAEVDIFKTKCSTEAVGTFERGQWWGEKCGPLEPGVLSSDLIP